VGDVIVRFNGTQVPEMRDLPRIVADTEINKKVKVEVIRRGKSKTLTIVTGRLEEPLVQKTEAEPEEPENTSDNPMVQGLTLADIDEVLRERFQIDPKVKGAVLLKVASDSHSAEKGLRPGDVISEVEQSETENAEEVVAAINDAAGEGMKKVLLLVTSRAGIRYVVIDLTP
jgi:serine protease Do